MRIYPSNAHEFKGKTVYTLWDNEECGGYGFWSTMDEAVDAALGIMRTPEGRSFYGEIPFMTLIAEVPSKVLGQYPHRVSVISRYPC